MSEYGDNADVMGNPTSGHLNAYQKERLGWLNYGDTPAILSVGQSGSYWIDSYAVNRPASAEPKALKVLKDINGSGQRTWYYAEARTQTGFDSSITPGVILHRGFEGSGREIYQLDLDPVTSAGDWRLDAGQMFEDLSLGLRITTLWVDATGAMIDVQFEAAPCTTAAPTMTVSPGGTVSTEAGSPVSYAVSVTNHDGSACPPSSFDFQAWVPAGWSSSFSPASRSVDPGASGGTTLTVTPSVSATGSSDIQIGAYRAGGSSVSVIRTVSITTAPPPPPPAATSLTVDMSIDEARNGYTISVAVGDGSSPVSGAQVTFTITDPDGGTRSFNSTTDGNGVAWTNYKPRKKDPTGIYAATAVVTAGAASGMGVGTFVVK